MIVDDTSTKMGEDEDNFEYHDIEYDHNNNATVNHERNKFN